MQTPRPPVQAPHAAASAAIGLALLSLAAFADVLLASGDVVLSHREADTFRYFAHVRAFAASEMLAGNLPLWNPHIFAGQPFLGAFQPALFYPPNLLYLVLPLDWAINLDATLHVFLMGWFGWIWVRGRGLEPLPAFYAAAVMMLCGALAMRVLAGQLTVLAAACWTPAILAVAERLLRRASLGVTLAGIAAVTLQILSGYPFYVFATALLVALVAAPRVWRERPTPSQWAALAAVGVAPLALAAVQLWTGLDTASESLRAGGVPYWFGASFSLPPANLLTAVAPTVFGDLPRGVYWGAYSYWDVCLFLGVTTVVLAAVGALRGDRSVRRGGALAVVSMLVLALGEHTPVYRVLFDWVPGFDSFRAPSKFALQASIFVALLAGAGLQRVIREPREARWGIGVAVGLAVLLAGGGLSIVLAPDAFDALVPALANPMRLHTVVDRETIAPGARAALWVAGATAAAVALLLAGRRRSVHAATALAVIGVAEVWLFAATHHDRFDLSELERPELERFYRERAGDDRVLDRTGRNHAMVAGGRSVWGYDPVQIARYARFGATVQNRGELLDWALDPDAALPRVPKLDRPDSLLRLVRARWVVDGWSSDAPPRELEGALPRLLLIGEVTEVESFDALLGVRDPEFDARRRAFVEAPLDPPPTVEGTRGSARIVAESTDHLEIEVDLPAPALLVLTDAYSRGWRARLEREGRRSEPAAVVPVDYFLMGVALPAGRQRLHLEYSPAAYRAGAWVSGLSGLAYLAVVAIWARGARGRRPTDPTGSARADQGIESSGAQLRS